MPEPTVDELMTYAVDGAGALTLVEYMKNYHNNNPGGGVTQIAAPVLSMSFASTGDSVTVTNNTDYNLVSGGNVVLAYTIDGTVPSQNSAVFVSPKTMDINCVLTVRAFLVLSESNMIPSPATAVNIATLKCQKPVISYDKSTKQVTITSPTSGATIYYTTNGDEPTSSSTAYTGPVTITGNIKTIKAIAVKTSVIDSDVVSSDVALAHVFGIRRKITGYSSPDWERLTPSTDPNEYVTETVTQEPQAEISGVQSGSSIFDNYGPWQKKMRNFLSDGTPGPWQDEEGFSLTDMDVMVYYPDCYIKLIVDTENDYVYRYISDSQIEGFEFAPWSRMYGARYETSNHIESRSGAAPQVQQNINTMRASAKTKGTGWGIHDWAERCANQWLFVVEYASYDSQTKIGMGIVSSQSAQNTGATDTMEYHTGMPAGVNGNTAIQYRYSENLWGNVMQWCDGINIIGGQVFVSTDRENYQSNIGNPYIPVGESITASFNGYIDSIVEYENVSWSFGIPDSSTGSASTYLCDRGYRLVDNTSVKTGGAYNYADEAGIFFFYVNTSASTDIQTGSRLTFRESKPFDPEITITAV